ncbi:MAG: SusC/RagA family TonB-linked outer membrane protein [Prevotella sp.]|jgi:TonB-linked SusC/RagA family outer membrane protein|nr:SusC/RagA family TonB-linked outer membrane protein [Prevotella sp.]
MKKPNDSMFFRYHLIFCILLLTFCYANANSISGNPRIETSRNLRESNELQQNKKVLKGIVKDEKGESIIGASVTVEGTTISTISDINGNFDIHVESGQVLKISYIGFISQEIKITDQDYLDIVLLENDRILDEIVVMGYGTAARKQDLSMAVSTVKLGTESLGRPTNLANMLQGKVAGVSINQSGDPTSSASINIRGKGNRNGDQILYVVDGVMGAPYNPADVESITILKDAASASIYGSYAGAGGVVLITTKQAAAGKAKIDANAWWGVQKAWRLPEVLTASEFNQVWKDVTTAKGRDLPNAYNPLIFPYGDITRTDWLDEVFRTGNMQHYDFTVRGGTEALKALASVSYTDTEGTIITTYRKNLNLRLNVDFQVTKWAKLSQRLTYDYTNGKGGIGGGHTGAIFNAMAYPRSATVFEYENGQKLYGGVLPRWAAADFPVESDLQNPVAMLEKVRVNNPVDRLFSTSSLELKPIPGLVIKSDFSFDVGNDRMERFQAKFTEPGLKNDQNYRQIYALRSYHYISDNIATYTNEFNNLHYLSLMGGITIQKSESRIVRAMQMGLSNETGHGAILNPNATWYTDENVDLKPENIEEFSSRSYLARIAYTYDDRYIINGSWRYDQPSLLHPDRNGKSFFAASGAWKITSEKFMPDLKPLNFAKLRLGWGQVGSVNSLRSFAYREMFEDIRSPVFFGDETEGGHQGIAKSSVANPYIKWEKTEQTSVGIDLEFFKNSLSVSVDYFHKNTKDLIEKQTSVSQAGVENPKKI